MLIPQANMIDFGKILNKQAKLASKMSKISILNDGTTNIITIPGKGATMKYVKLIEGFNFTPRRMASGLFAGAVMFATANYQINSMSKDMAKMSEDITELKVGQAKLQATQTKISEDITELKVGQAKMSEDITELKVGQAKLEAGQAKLEAGQAKLEALILQLISNQK